MNKWEDPISGRSQQVGGADKWEGPISGRDCVK